MDYRILLENNNEVCFRLDENKIIQGDVIIRNHVTGNEYKATFTKGIMNGKCIEYIRKKKIIHEIINGKEVSNYIEK